MGVLALVLGLGTAAGPALAGILAEVTGTRVWAVAIAALTAAAAALILRPARSRRKRTSGLPA